MDIKLTKRQKQFLQQEFGIDPEKADTLSGDEWYTIQDRCFDIELEGDLADGSKMPDRCGIASELVSLIAEL